MTLIGFSFEVFGPFSRFSSCGAHGPGFLLLVVLVTSQLLCGVPGVTLFPISNSVMLSSDNRNSLIIGCSLQVLF